MAEEMAERDANNSEEQSISRRRAMEKLGRYGLYTAPAMLAMLDTAQATVPFISGRHPVMLTPNSTYGGVSKPKKPTLTEQA